MPRIHFRKISSQLIRCLNTRDHATCYCWVHFLHNYQLIIFSCRICHFGTKLFLFPRFRGKPCWSRSVVSWPDRRELQRTFHAVSQYFFFNISRFYCWIWFKMRILSDCLCEINWNKNDAKIKQCTCCSLVIWTPPDDGARGKVRGSPKSVGFILWEAWTCAPRVMAIHRAVV